VKILRAKATRDAAGKESTFTLRGRPVTLQQVENHRRRARLDPIRANVHVVTPAGVEGGSTRDLVCRTPPPSPHASLPVIESWRVSEKLLYDVDVLVKGSFECGRWKWVSNQLIIESSEQQLQDKLAIHDMLGSLANGVAAANARDYELAFKYWQQSFVKVDALVKGQYHDIIPNLIQQINDLNSLGLVPVAASFKAHMAEASAVYGTPGTPSSAIFAGLGSLDMSLLVGAEERIMAHFHALFEQYLGYRSYNSFVMMMDGARRRLLHQSWTTFADCLPDIAHLDADFGSTDRRPLDVLGLRLEILKKRGMPHEAEPEALEMIRRAERTLNDDWQRYYNLTRGWYFLGWARYAIPEKRSQAVACFETALTCDDELCKIEDFHIFVSERTEMLKYLGELRDFGVDEFRS
jgi:hypothetical protein